MEEESAEERLLYNARHGDVDSVHDLLQQRSTGEIQLNIDCEGRSKANLGWTPLHLASYFGHKDVVQQLLDNGANVNVVNNVGDTPLHRAAFTGRMEVVMLLLKNKAKVDMINAEGNSPNGLARTSEIKNLIEATEAFEQRCLEEQFLKLAREGDTEGLTKMLRSPHPPNINCTDTFGNTALHSAAYCRQRATAALLLENGINTSVKNNKGQVALDMARDEKMCQLLDVLPIKKVQRNVQRFEGPLLKKSRIFGWKPIWVVLERGVLGVFKCRGDASTGSRRKAFKYLDDARVQARQDTAHVFGVHFSDNTSFLLSVLPGDPAEVTRQKWENALNEHITYSTHFVHQGVTVSDDEDDLDILPLGSMQDVLQSSNAHHHLLEKEVQQLTAALEALPADQLNDKAVALLQTRDRLAQIVQLSKEMCSSLSHCLDVFTQQEQVRKLRLQQEVEKSRVLEDALHILAEQHNQLEQSIGCHRSPTGMFDPEDDDEFFDCADNDARTQSSNFSELFHSFNETAISCSTPLHSTRHQTQHECSKTNGNSLEQNCGAEGQSSIMCGGDQDVGRNNSGGAKQMVAEPDVTGVSKWGGRRHLPAPMFSKNDFSVWSILKQCIGRELSKITMPVIFNEPLSFLERIAEYMEYTSLVEQAAACDDPVERLELVTAFAVSATASNWDRLGKPFNPLLGETYELEREDLGFKIVCEQVSHHPPVSAFHAQSDVFHFYGSIHPKLKFWGKSIEITPKGTVTLHLLKHEEVYTWQNVNCCVHNIIVGKLWIEHYGSMEIVNHKTKHKAVVNFKPCGWFGKDLHVIDGGVYDSSGQKVREFYGKWIEALYSYDIGTWENHQRALHEKGTSTVKVTEESREKAISCNQHIPGQRLLWVAEPKPDDSSQYYSFTTFAMMLNETDADLCKKLPPTDARRRPDIRKMEEGDLDGATTEKTRLEEKQRFSRKERRRTKEEWKPAWFSWSIHEELGREDWICSSDYWQRDWDKCPDIF